MRAVVQVAVLATMAAACMRAAEPVTFNRDIFPILQKRCQSCHRPGQIGPMPLMTYAQVRPWAKAVRDAVKLKKMPPWFVDASFAETSHGGFTNNPSLTPDEKIAIDAWVEGGALEGSKKETPKVARRTEGWNTSPDIVIGMPKPFAIPAKKAVDYQYVILPSHFTYDRWVTQVEVKPSNFKLVHHAVLFVRPAGSPWLRDAKPGEMYAPPASDREAVRKSRETQEDILTVYTPGSAAAVFPTGMAKRIPAGADLVLQIHYTALDVDASDQTEIGLVVTQDKPKMQIVTLQMGRDDLVIPAGESSYRASVSGILPGDALLVNLFPHMHLRGSAFEYAIVAPEGRVDTLLRVKPFDFQWQLTYWFKTPIPLKKGTRLRWTGWFDNSKNNPRNPDPSVEVHWGEQSWEEMMIGFFDVAIETDSDKRKFFVR